MFILKKKKIQSLQHCFPTSAHSRSVFKGLGVILQNQSPYGENEWDVYFHNQMLSPKKAHSIASCCF